MIVKRNGKMKTSIIKLSYNLEPSTPVYGGGQGFFFEKVKSIVKGDSCNTQKWSMGNHVGTHIDSPNHFFENGKPIDAFAPDFWKSHNVQLIEINLDSPRYIFSNDIKEKLNTNVECLFFKTGFCYKRSSDDYFLDYPGLSAELAIWLRENFKNLKYVGMDFISVSRIKEREEGRESHRKFLDPVGNGNPILLIEDVDLSNVSSENKFNNLWIVPLFIKDADGSPVTIFAEYE